MPTPLISVLGALAVAGSAVAVGASPANAASNIPWTGALCDAMENIQFWNDQGETSYTVQAGEQIRVDRFYGVEHPNAEGHGTGHSSRWFYWRHTNSPTAYRVQNCR